MATQKTNSFTSYDLTDKEVLQGSIFTELQLQVLQNHLASYAEEKIALDYDPTKHEQFLQDEASLKAKIELLTYLIETSSASLDILTTQHTNSEEQNYVFT